MKEIAKQWAFDFIRLKPINVGLRTLLKPISHHLPYRLVNNIPVVGQIQLKLPNGKQLILVSDGCDSLASRIFWSGIQGFEPETIRLFLHLAKNAETVFDIGAHVGLFALLAAIGGEHRTIYAFEPVPRIIRYLETNVAVNFAQNVKIIPHAATNCDGEILLYIPDSIRLPATASTLSSYRSHTAEITVPATKLDTFARQNHLSQIDLVKIDAEGAEDKVLDGARFVLERDNPTIICEVLHGFVSDTLEDILRRLDYKFFLITDAGLIHHEHIIGDASYFYKNYLFISKKKITTALNGINILS